VFGQVRRDGVVKPGCMDKVERGVERAREVCTCAFQEGGHVGCGVEHPADCSASPHLVRLLHEAPLHTSAAGISPRRAPQADGDDVDCRQLFGQVRAQLYAHLLLEHPQEGALRLRLGCRTGRELARHNHHARKRDLCCGRRAALLQPQGQTLGRLPEATQVVREEAEDVCEGEQQAREDFARALSARRQLPKSMPRFFVALALPRNSPPGGVPAHVTAGKQDRPVGEGCGRGKVEVYLATAVVHHG
jgi:hypothetical protein